ncbi:hypothetical protein U1Q18_041794 [Sarracenia purpurea var. burkii]
MPMSDSESVEGDVVLEEEMVSIEADAEDKDETGIVEVENEQRFAEIISSQPPVQVCPGADCLVPKMDPESIHISGEYCPMVDELIECELGTFGKTHRGQRHQGKYCTPGVQFYA